METRIDSRRSEAFARRLASQLNEAMLAIMASIAYQTGLFDVMAGLPPSTSQAIAAAAGLDERYVREWLAAMVTGRIVDYDGARRTYHLPPEHAAHLTRRAGTDDMAGRTQWVAALAQLEAAVVQCFRTGGGLAAAAFSPVRALEAREDLQREVGLLETIVARLPEIAAELEAGIDVLHLRRDPRARSTPIVEGFTASRHFEAADIDGLAGDSVYDLVMAHGILHDHISPARLFGDIHRCLRPGANLVCVEAAASSNVADNLEHPWAPMLYAVSTLRSLPASLAANGAALGTMWGEEHAQQLLTQAGFGSVRVIRLTGDASQNCVVARR